MVWRARSITSWWRALAPAELAEGSEQAPYWPRRRCAIARAAFGCCPGAGHCDRSEGIYGAVAGLRDDHPVLRARGFNAHKGTGFATTGIRILQESGIIDLYWEYTGTSLSEFNQVKEKLSPEEGFAWVKALDAKRGLVWLAPSKVNNTYALAVRRADALGKGMRSISDLATKLRAGEGMKLASTAEFLTRADGLRPLQQAYGFEFMSGNVVAM